jgi:hypothetical protein
MNRTICLAFLGVAVAAPVIATAATAPSRFDGVCRIGSTYYPKDPGGKFIWSPAKPCCVVTTTAYKGDGDPPNACYAKEPPKKPNKQQ